jgi:hypothetical protein
MADDPKRGVCPLCNECKTLFRRDVCRNCHYKFTGSSVPMPPPAKRGARALSNEERLRRWAASLSREHRIMLATVLVAP